MSEVVSEKKELSFEGAMGRLEEIVSALEKGDAPLDKSLELFEEGVTLVKLCSARLEDAEQKVKILVGGKETDFVGNDR